MEREILPELFNGKRSVMGHSMGGHGSIMCFMRKPGFFTSCSAFAPVGNPSAVEGAPGAKAFTAYLGPKDTILPNGSHTTRAASYGRTRAPPSR